MDNLLVIREQLKELYRKHGTVIMIVLKFVTVLMAMFLLSSKIGTMDLLTNPLIITGISAICAILPGGLIVLVLALVMTAHIYAISLEMAVFVLVVLMIMFMLFFRFSSGDSFILVLLPLLFALKIPFVIPLAMGLFATPFSIVSVMFGVVVYFILNYISVNYDTLVNATDGFAEMSAMADAVFANQSMYLVIIAFSIVLVAVFIIRKLSVDYAWMIAVCAGMVVNVIILIIGEIGFGLSDIISLPMLIIGNILSLLIATVLCFFFHHVDYVKTERVQFEDDNYYYYVKAIPKIKSNMPKNRRRVRR